MAKYSFGVDPFASVRKSKLAELVPPPEYFDINSMFKELYSDKIKDLIPDGTKLLNRTIRDAVVYGSSAYPIPFILGDEKKKP